MNVEDHLLYTKEHEWVHLEDDIATIGISDYAQEALGDITYIELPEIDGEFDQFEQFASIESVKAASDIYCPLSGRVIEVNTELNNNPELINKDCYEKGWIARIKVTNPEESSKLMNSDEYANYLKSLE